MYKRKEELIVPVKVKAISNCSYALKNLSFSNYGMAMRLIRYLSSTVESGGLGYDIAYDTDINDSSKFIIFCEKSDKKEVFAHIKKWLS